MQVLLFCQCLPRIMNKEEIIKKAMSELGKKSGAKKTPDQMRAMANKRWANRKKSLEK